MTREMTTPDDFTRVLAGDGWQGIDAALASQAGRAARGRAAEEERLRERQRLAAAVARILASDDGRLLIEHMLDATLRRPVLELQPERPMDQAVIAVARREGQNGLVQELLRLAAEGSGETPPPPRD